MVGRREGKEKFCSSVLLHRRIAFVCRFHRFAQRCGSSEALPLCEAMWARLRWRDQGHFGRLRVLLAVSRHEEDMCDSSSLVYRWCAIGNRPFRALVRACMILFQVTEWLDERVPLSRRDAAPRSGLQASLCVVAAGITHTCSWSYACSSTPCASLPFEREGKSVTISM